MPRVGFEPTVPAFERAKTIHASDRAVTVIGCTHFTFIKNRMKNIYSRPTSLHSIVNRFRTQQKRSDDSSSAVDLALFARKGAVLMVCLVSVPSLFLAADV
jgi:hypothetical protein